MLKLHVVIPTCLFDHLSILSSHISCSHFLWVSLWISPSNSLILSSGASNLLLLTTCYFSEQTHNFNSRNLTGCCACFSHFCQPIKVGAAATLFNAIVSQFVRNKLFLVTDLSSSDESYFLPSLRNCTLISDAKLYTLRLTVVDTVDFSHHSFILRCAYVPEKQKPGKFLPDHCCSF